MKMTRKHWAVALALGASGLAVLPAAADTPATPGDAAPILRSMRDAMGGADHWQAARYLRFDWAVERDGKEVVRVKHLWDRSTGHYRVEWKNKEGHQVQSLFDINSHAGRTWIDGTAVASADSAANMEKAYARYINDSYWLLMPWKLDDPGANVESLGRRTVDGQEFDVLHITFNKVGLTPGDQYWAFVDRKTHMMARWAYFLEGTEGTPSLENATVWQWSDWQKMGSGVMMSRDRRMVGGKPGRIYFPVVETPAAVDAAVFTDPHTAMPEEAQAKR